MDWITGIQRALDYVEAHITDSIDYDEVAKQAYSSSFHFQRVFSILCGFTLGDYIRMRRLSLAGGELSSSDIKVIDAALKYGYDSPESFSRAFTRFHGVSPSQAKQTGAALKSFSALSVKLTLDGGNTMDYRIETREAFKIICKKKQISSEAEYTGTEVSGFWADCGKNGTIGTLCKYMPEHDLFNGCILGACYNGAPVTDEGFTVEEIPAHTYAVFPCRGKMPESFQTLYRQIYSEYFPTSEYEPCGGLDIETYPSGNVGDPGYTCEVWMAVKKK